MHPQKLPGLQIGRAAAALTIAYVHSWHVTTPFPPGTAFPIQTLLDRGAVAVDFFFAISGFVICMVVTSPRFEPLAFAVRRAFRLYPIWIATACVYLGLTHFLGRAPEQTLGFFLFSLTLLPTHGYPFYDVGWSLQHEIAFYLLAALAQRFFGIRGLVAALAAGGIADRLFNLPWPLHQYFSYYPDFLVGVAAFVIAPRVIFLGAFIPLAASACIIGFVAGAPA
jgi:exopolysaccharide production protein ExoZ